MICITCIACLPACFRSGSNSETPVIEINQNGINRDEDDILPKYEILSPSYQDQEPPLYQEPPRYEIEIILYE